MSFADAIIKLRSERRISQKELAEDLNVSCATVSGFPTPAAKQIAGLRLRL